MEYGIISLVPPLVAIILALITKKTIISLFLGVWVGATIIHGWNPLVGLPTAFSDFMIPQIADAWNAGLIILVAMAGGFVYMVRASGAARALKNVAQKRVDTPKKAQATTWFAAFAFIYTEPTLTLGAIMRPITDAVKVSRAKLAYILDSMGANLASISPISSYGPFITGLIGAQLTAIGLADDPWAMFVRMIPYNVYGLVAMVIVLIVIAWDLNIGPMKKEENRARETGKLIGDDAEPMGQDEEMDIPEKGNITIKNFAIPLGSLFVAIFATIFWSGNILQEGFRGAFLEGDIVIAIIMGFLVGSIAAGGIGIHSGVLDLDSAFENWKSGIINLMFVPIILVLAWSIGAVATEMGLPAYLTGIVEAYELAVVLPAIIFTIGAIVAFSTGSSWGVFAIMLPITIPMAHEVGVPLPLAIGATIGSGLMGDHCSPISDTTIMSSTGAACDHIVHVNTQLPYAISVGVATVIAYLIGMGIGVPILSLPIGFIIAVIFIYILSKYFEDLNILSRFGKKASE